MKESDFLYFYIKGVLTHKDEGFVVVENNGIGYKLTVSDTTFSAVRTNEPVTLYTHLYVREDIMELYGFSTVEEKNMFLSLMTVSGVGAKAAIAILSIGTPAEIAAAVITNDAKAIQKAQGIGAKTAQRVILELHDKIKCEDIVLPAEVNPSDSGKLTEAVGALTALGYSESEAASALRGVDLSLDTEEIVKQGLKNLFKGV